MLMALSTEKFCSLDRLLMKSLLASLQSKTPLEQVVRSSRLSGSSSKKVSTSRLSLVDDIDDDSSIFCSSAVVLQ